MSLLEKKMVKLKVIFIMNYLKIHFLMRSYAKTY